MIGIGKCGLSLAFVLVGLLIGGVALMGGSGLGRALFLATPMLMMGLFHCLMLRKVLRRGLIRQLENDLVLRREY